MSEPTTTRAEIRRQIGRMTRQSFFLRYRKDGYVPITASSTTAPGSITSSDKLIQASNKWQNTFAYDVTADEDLLVTASSSDGLLVLEWPQTAASTAADELELWDMWPASGVNSAINDVLRSDECWHAFPNVVTDETLIMKEDTLIYDLSGLTSAPARILEMYIEDNNSVVTGVATTGSTTYLDDTTANLDTDADSDWFVSVYEGTCKGDLLEVTSVSSDQRITPAADFSATPDTTTKYALWDAAEQEIDWYKLVGVRFDQIENPNEFHLYHRYTSAYGMRFRLVYEAQSSTMADDTAETVVPKMYVVYKAMSFLYDELVGDNRVDRQ